MHRLTLRRTQTAASAIDGRTKRHARYAVSQRIRKRIEEAFGWIKTIGGQGITDHGRGEIAFVALQAGIEYSPSSVGFTWEGFDEMDEVSGDGSAELLDDGSIEIEFAYHNGDEAVLKAKRETSSTAC